MRRRPQQRARAQAQALTMKSRFAEFVTEVKACWDFMWEQDRQQREAVHAAVLGVFRKC